MRIDQSGIKTWSPRSSAPSHRRFTPPPHPQDAVTIDLHSTVLDRGGCEIGKN